MNHQLLSAALLHFAEIRRHDVLLISNHCHHLEIH